MAEDLAGNNPGMTLPTSRAHTHQSTNTSFTRHDSRIHAAPEDRGDFVENSEESECSLTKHDVGWRRLVRNFSPSWFSVTMGTGIVAVLLNIIPFHAQWLYYLSLIFFVLNVLLFAIALAISTLRYTLYPEIWGVMIRDPTNSLFLATVPMGFATLVKIWINVCVPAWGHWAVLMAWIMWMIDSIASFAITAFLSFNLMSEESRSSLSRITAAQLLPIAATIVAAATGASLADVIENPQHALATVITCYVMWGMSVPLALTVIVVYYQRLAVYKLPAREVIVSCFLPLGPLGYGGFTILYLGRVCIKLFPTTNSLPLAADLAAPILYITGFLIAIIFWGFGIMWMVFALASIYKSRPFPFNMGWWGFTFPLGVFAASTIQIGIEIPSTAFKVFGTIFSCIVILLWIVVAIGTARGAWNGKLFYAPCLANLKNQEDSEKKAADPGNSRPP